MPPASKLTVLTVASVLGLMLLAACTSTATSTPLIPAASAALSPAAGPLSATPAGSLLASTGSAAAPVGSPPAGDDAQASAVVSQFGAVPIPSGRGAADPTPTASSGRPQLLAMGAPVIVRLAGVSAVATALGPVQLAAPAGPTPAASTRLSAGTTPSLGAASPAGPQRRTAAEITLTLTATTGSLTVGAADLNSRNQTGAAVPLTAHGPGQVTATPGRPATLVVRGTYDNGSAQLTWRHGGAVVAVWVFTIELD